MKKLFAVGAILILAGCVSPENYVRDAQGKKQFYGQDTTCLEAAAELRERPQSPVYRRSPGC